MSSTDEKTPPGIEALPNDHSSSMAASDNLDSAWAFLDRHRDEALRLGASTQLSDVDIAVVRRKVDWHIVSLMFLCYTTQFLDKVAINYGAVMGLTKDLKLVGSEFSNVATFFFVAYLIFEIPNTYCLQMLPAGKWLGVNVILWGVATASGAAAHSYHTLLASRIFVGIFEATIGPSLLLISSRWYTKSEQAVRFSFWYLGLGVGQITGGAISFGFQHLTAGEVTLAGWRIMFVVLGCATVVIGFLTVWFLPDTPMQARWLSDVEKVVLLRHVSVNQTGVENRTKFRWAEIVEALCDPQIYLLLLSTICLSVPSGVVTTYSATLISHLGYNSKQAALMNMPSGASHRWAWTLACIIPGIIGGALMSFMPTSNKAGCLAGIYLVNAITAPLPIFYAWTAANVAGSTKRAFAAALVSGSFSIGNIMGPQTFQPRDAPDYRPAKLAVMGSLAGAALTTCLLFCYYYIENRRRDRSSSRKESKDSDLSEEDLLSRERWLNITDRKNSRFRYVY
ncbi:allantoate permease [Roridomyces roridus]|uniref:Allantoate permease n=1 Tax=Roridomyces roridus TaxID=1738132 RepID=A0AAD7B1Y5_9AGAR|nr:allantoate permease [Roridomyces roridus]